MADSLSSLAKAEANTRCSHLLLQVSVRIGEGYQVGERRLPLQCMLTAPNHHLVLLMSGHCFQD